MEYAPWDNVNSLLVYDTGTPKGVDPVSCTFLNRWHGKEGKGGPPNRCLYWLGESPALNQRLAFLDD